MVILINRSLIEIYDSRVVKIGNKLPLFSFFNGPIPAFSFVFSTCHSLILNFLIDNSIDGVLGIRTRGGRIEGADKSTELRPLFLYFRLSTQLTVNVQYNILQ